MAILPLSSSYALGVPFCDYLNVTSPLDHYDDILRQLRPFLDVLGLSETLQGTYSAPNKGGTLKLVKTKRVVVVSASGGLLDALRSAGLFDQFLAELSAFPHRVSMLHATQDYSVPSPPDVVQAVKIAGQSGGISLTRKAVHPSKVRAFLSVDQNGQETGTIYLGDRKNADVWAKVYDKQHERLSRGYQDPGKVVRVEIAIQSDVGATLKDAHSPVSLFYHFASKTLVERAPDVPEWIKQGEGYSLPSPKVDFLPMERLYQLAGNSLDISRLVRTAVDLFGSEAPDVLSTLMRRQALRVLNPSTL